MVRNARLSGMTSVNGMRFIVAASLLGTPSVHAVGATLSLVQHGKPVYAVVVPDVPPRIIALIKSALAG